MNQTGQSEAFLARAEIHEEWQADYLAQPLNSLYDEAFARVVQALGAKPGDRILDGGCGSCVHAVRLAHLKLNVTGIDFSASALANARRTLEAEGVGDRVQLLRGDLLRLPLPDGAFRFVSSWGVLMHIPEVEKALAEIARVLTPGGRVSLMENNANSLQVRTWDSALRVMKRSLGRPVHQRTRSPRGIEEWRSEGLMVRRTDPAWLEQTMSGLGLKLVNRFAGQFTEAYTSIPVPPVKKALFALNRAYLRYSLSPDWALGNIFIFEKR